MKKAWGDLSVEDKKAYINKVRMAGTVIKSMMPETLREKISSVYEIEDAAMDFLEGSLGGSSGGSN